MNQLHREGPDSSGPSRVNGVRAEHLLLGAVVVALALIAVEIDDAYSGLPAHPLLLHIPVVLIPAAALGALLIVAWPGWLERWGGLLAFVTGAALIGLVLTMGSGEELRKHLAFAPGSRPDLLIAGHADAAATLRLLFFAFTLAVAGLLFASRDERRRPRGLWPVLRVAIAALALGSIVWVVHTGDLGAKAVWKDRLTPAFNSHDVIPGGGMGMFGG